MSGMQYIFTGGSKFPLPAVRTRGLAQGERRCLQCHRAYRVTESTADVTWSAPGFQEFDWREFYCSSTCAHSESHDEPGCCTCEAMDLILELEPARHDFDVVLNLTENRIEEVAELIRQYEDIDKARALLQKTKGAAA